MTEGTEHPNPAFIEEAERWSASNYKPLPVVLERGRASGSGTSRATATWTCSPPTRR
jgi:hypothetical protein